jgi:hypothetical protein
MANAARGEAAFEIEGKTYTLSFSINALCELEDAMGEGVTAVTRRLSDESKLRLRDVRTVFWAGLRDHHPEIDLAGAGNLMTALGQVEAIEIVGKALALAFPAGDGRPLAKGPPAARGTGRRS